MKILFIEFYLPYLLKDAEFPAGGWTNELNVWLKGLDGCDCDVGVLTWRGAVDYVGREKKFGFDLLETYKPRTGIKFLRYFYVYIPALLKATRAYGPDVIVQSSSGIETGIMAFVAKKLKIPFVHRVASDRDADDRIYRANIPFYAKSAYRYGLKNSTATICQNRYQQEALRKRYPGKKHYVLHNPFAPEGKLPEPEECVKEAYVAWVGIFKYEKNIPLLCEIAAQNPDVFFRVAGMKGKHADSTIDTAVEKLMLLPNVKLEGFVKRKDILPFLCNAVALLSTSHLEGFSNVLLEAMAVGTPVVLPERIDPDNVIASNRLGFVAKDDGDFSSLLKQMINLPSTEYQKMSSRCRSYVKENHDPVNKARQLLEVLGEVSSSAFSG